MIEITTIYLISTVSVEPIIFNEKSKKTILAFTFCSICICASLNSSIIPITFRSLIKGAKRVAKFCSGESCNSSLCNAGYR